MFVTETKKEMTVKCEADVILFTREMTKPFRSYPCKRFDVFCDQIIWKWK